MLRRTFQFLLLPALAGPLHAGVTAPAIFFHGSTGTVVDPAASLLFKTDLEAAVSRTAS